MDRACGWPRLIPDKNPEIAKVSAYFDAVNFARYIRCPTLMAVGLIDTTCPAMTVYSAFNVIQGPKQMVATPLMGHSQSREYGELREHWIPEQAFGPPEVMRMGLGRP